MTTALPRSIMVDHGPEFRSRALEDWAWQHGVQLDFTRPAKPPDNGPIESFNGRLRDGCLNVQQFVSLTDAKDKIEAWLCDYNQVRPHGSLRHLTPAEFVTQGQGNGIREAAHSRSELYPNGTNVRHRESLTYAVAYGAKLPHYHR